MRLIDKLNVYESNKGDLTCIVLDTAQGCPASRMRITLHRLKVGDNDNDKDNNGNERELVNTFITNENLSFKWECTSGPFMSGITLPGAMSEWEVCHF